MVTLIEGPDRCGKTSLAKSLAKEAKAEFLFLPSPIIRPLIFSGELNNPFLFFADAHNLWNKSNIETRDIVLDRDILSMLAYQGFLLGQLNPIVILNLYKSVVYEHNRPDEIIYVTNEPFAPYDDKDPFEMYGYNAIRMCYEQAVHLFELNFPEIPIKRVEIEYDSDRC